VAVDKDELHGIINREDGRGQPSDTQQPMGPATDDCRAGF
jgi:hypothetical protein